MLTGMMTSAQVVETVVNVTTNSPSQDYSHLDDLTTQMTETPEFKPFIIDVSLQETMYQTNRFHLAMCMYFDNSWRLSESGKNVSHVNH